MRIRILTTSDLMSCTGSICFFHTLHFIQKLLRENEKKKTNCRHFDRKGIEKKLLFSVFSKR